MHRNKAVKNNRGHNPDHNLWNNNGTWFIHYTRYPTPVTKERVRHSLGTKSLVEARAKRDAILRSVNAGSGVGAVQEQTSLAE